MPNRLTLILCLPVFLLTAGEQLLAQTTEAPRSDEPVSRQGDRFESIKGIVTFQAEIPKGPPDEVGEVHDLLEVDRDTRGLRHVVAYLDASANSSAQASAAPATGHPPPVVNQINHQFVPRVLAVRAGEPVLFTSRDIANHNVRASASHRSNEFNVFTGTGARYEHRFVADAAGQPIELDCDIHPWMRGWIYAFDHSWFAVTDEKGRFRIDSVPPGDYTLVLQQPDIRYQRRTNITVTADSPTSVEIAIRARRAAATNAAVPAMDGW